MKNKKLFLGIYIILLFILFISLTILAILGKKERVGYLSEFKINVDNTLELNHINIEEIKELFGSKFDYDSITNYLLTNESITIYSYDFRIKYYDKIFRNSDIYGVYPNFNNLPEYIKLANMDDNSGTPFGNLVSTNKLIDFDKVDNINYVLKLKNKLILIYVVLLIILLIFICVVYRNNIYKFTINAIKNKILISKICFIIIALIIISIIVLAFLGKKYREGYLSDFNFNIDNTLQINNLDINETKKLFTIDAKLNEVAITNYIFTNSSITNYSYNFRIKYYSKIFRNSDLYSVYPNLDNLPEYIKSARMNFKLGGPFGVLISDKELEYDDKIDIKYYLLINYNIYYYFASIFAIIMIFIGFYLLNKYLIYKKNLIYDEYSFLNKIEIVGLILFIFKIWLFYPGHYGYYDTIYSSMLGVIGSNSGNHHPVLTELNIGLIDKLGLSMGVFFIINTFLIYISLFLIILSLYIKYKNKMVILLYLVTFIAQIFFNSIVYLKDYLATLYAIFSFSIVFFIIVSDIKNIKIRNILKAISLISLVIGMLHRHNFIVTVYPILLWFTYDFLKTKNISNARKYIFNFIFIMFINAIILMSIFYIFPRIFVNKSVTSQIQQILYVYTVGTLVEAKDYSGSTIPQDLYSDGITFNNILDGYEKLKENGETYLYLWLWSQTGYFKSDSKKRLETLFNTIQKYPIAFIKFIFDFNITRCTMRYYGYYSPIFDESIYKQILPGIINIYKITEEQWYDSSFYKLNKGANYSKLQSNTYNFLVNTLPDINISVFTIISILLFFITGLLWILKRNYRNDLLLLSFSLAFSAFATIILLFVFSNVIDYRFIYPIIPISILSLISFVSFIYDIINNVENKVLMDKK